MSAAAFSSARFTAFLAVIAILFAVGIPKAHAEDVCGELVTLDVRDGVTQSYALIHGHTSIPTHGVIVLMAGGKVSNRITAPKFSKVVVAYIPNEPPRWPTTVSTIKKIVEAYSQSARKYERLGDWAERIGWERFFEVCELDFTHHLIDDFRDPAYYTWRQTTQFKF